MNLGSYSRVHLEWLFENQPELVRDLHRRRELAGLLENKLQQALRRVTQLKRDAGMHPEEAFEVAMHEILAPSDGPAMSDEPPEPLPPEEQEEIYRQLEEE